MKGYLKNFVNVSKAKKSAFDEMEFLSSNTNSSLSEPFSFTEKEEKQSYYARKRVKRTVPPGINRSHSPVRKGDYVHPYKKPITPKKRRPPRPRPRPRSNKPKMISNSLFELATRVLGRQKVNAQPDDFDLYDEEEKREYEEMSAAIALKKHLKKRKSKVPRYRIWGKMLFPRGKKNMKLLNPKVLTRVFEFCSPKILKNVFLSCKYWYGVTNTFKFWENYFFAHFGHVDYFNFKVSKIPDNRWKNHFVDEYINYQKCFRNLQFQNGIKIAFVGDSSTGKTTVLNILLHNRIPKRHIATLGAITQRYELQERNYSGTHSAKPIKLQIWDCGSKQYLKTIHLYYQTADLIILFYDITSMKTFNVLEGVYNKVKVKKRENPTQLFDIVLIGTKIDKEKQRQVDLGTIRLFLENNPDVVHFEIDNMKMRKCNMEGFFLSIIYKTIEKRLF